MKSVGEVMAIGRTFAESLQKALRALETGLVGLDEVEIAGIGQDDDKNALRAALSAPKPDRMLKIAQAFRHGADVEQVHASCKIDPVVPASDRRHCENRKPGQRIWIAQRRR